MAQVYPNLNQIAQLTVKPTEGEQCLLNFLHANLDDTYEIYFQPFINGDRPDIVIMRKDSGVLIWEVKDWHLRHYTASSGNTWTLNKNDAFIVSPLKQVETYKDNMFELHQYLRQSRFLCNQ